MPRYLRVFISAAQAVVVLIIVACADSDAAGRQPLGELGSDTADVRARASESKVSLSAIAALVAGNAAYRAKQMDKAMAHYREAAAAAPDHAAPWFGLYMVANEMKNAALADSAMSRVKALSTDPAAFNAHAKAVSPSAARELPPGHPSTQQLPPGHPAPATPPAPQTGTAPVKKGSV